MSTYTPTINEISDAYIHYVKTVENPRYEAKGHASMSEAEILGEFDRFITSIREGGQ